MLSTVAFIITFLILLENSKSDVINFNSSEYIKSKWKNTKELLAKSHSSLYVGNENIITTVIRDRFNNINEEENRKGLSDKIVDRDANTLHLSDKAIFLKYIKKLEKLLDYRIKKNTKKNWLKLRKIYLERGNINSVSLEMREGIALNQSTPVPPVKLKNLLLSSLRDVADLSASENFITFQNEKGYFLSGDIKLNGAIHFEEMSVSNLNANYLSDRKAETLLISEVDQSFSRNLRTHKNLIKNLEVSSICDLPFKYWLRKHTSSENDLNLKSFLIYNETVVSIVKDMHHIIEMNVNKINDIDIKNLINTSFLLKENQVIRGNLDGMNLLSVARLQTGKINNVTSSKLFNKVKNETIDEMVMDRLEVYNLLVDKINEVTVKDAARMSEKNVIKGKVTINNLLIKDEVTVKPNIAVPLNNSMQVYEEIFIDGNVFVKNIQIESESDLILKENDGNEMNEMNQVNVDQVLEESWRKSEDQIILQNIRFEKGAAINELECRYLNGLTERDFVYSSSNILQLENVIFAHVYLVEQFINENKSAGSLKILDKLSPELIIFNQIIRFSDVSADRILLDNYNGIPVDYIMQNSDDPFTFDICPDIQILRVAEQMVVQHLNINWVNGRNASIFEKAIRSDEQMHIKVDKVVGKLNNVMNMKDVKIKNLCGKNFEDGLLRQQILIDSSKNGTIALTVAGVLEVENNLKIISRKINEKDLEYYVNELKNLPKDSVFDLRRIKKIEVLKHLNANYFLEEKLHDIFAKALSISSQQSAPSLELIAEHVKIDYLTSEIFNEKKVSSLLYRDKPLLIYGNKHFSSLFIKGNIKTHSLNDEFITTKKMADQLKIDGAMLNNLSVHIFGRIFWEDNQDSKIQDESGSVQELFRYAITKSDDQSINCSLTIEQNTTIDSLNIANKNSNLNNILNKIVDILSDCLIDRDDSVVIGEKVFKKLVEVHDLKVLKNIKIRSINDVPYDKIISQIFQKSKDRMALGKLSFFGELEVELLKTHSIHRESSIDKFVFFPRINDGVMPNQLVFKHLIIERNVSLFKLDGLEFDEFIMNRVTITEPYEIYVDVRFNQSTTVLNNASMKMINGIRPQQFVLKHNRASGVLEPVAATLIKDKKSFSSLLSIESNLDVSSPTFDFNDSFINVDEIEIFGNLLIDDDVESSKDIILLGQLNNAGLALRDEEDIEELRKSLLKKALALDQLLTTPTNKPAGELRYLEKITNFNLQWLVGVQSVTSTRINQSSTRLDLYMLEDGDFCGLSTDCPCKSYLPLEISSSGNYKVIQAKRANVLFNFYEPTHPFGLTIVTEPNEAAQSSDYCLKSESKVTNIFWTQLNAYGESTIEKLAVRIHGFIADAQVFLINHDKLYMVLATFYDNTLQSYAAYSLVYEFDLKRKSLTKTQSIATEGAKAVHIFQVAETSVYALIGCVKGKAESLLLRFDPITRQFQLVRTFTTGGSKHIASVSIENKSFVILSNPDIEALQIYVYNAVFDNFYDYQNLYFQSRVSSLSVFYSEDFGQSKAYFTVTTKDGSFYIYQYTFSGKFNKKIAYRIEDFQVLSAFRIENQNYLFAAHRLNSTIFKIVQDNN